MITLRSALDSIHLQQLHPFIIGPIFLASKVSLRQYLLMIFHDDIWYYLVDIKRKNSCMCLR